MSNVTSCTPAQSNDVEDIYTTRYIDVPHTERVCEDVYVWWR